MADEEAQSGGNQYPKTMSDLGYSDEELERMFREYRDSMILEELQAMRMKGREASAWFDAVLDSWRIPTATASGVLKSRATWDILFAQCALVASREHLDVALEAAYGGDGAFEVVVAVSRSLAQLEEVMDDLYRAQAQIWTPSKEKRHGQVEDKKESATGTK